jgi:hypothetical protein
VASLAREETIERQIAEMDEEIRQLQEQAAVGPMEQESAEERVERVARLMGRYTVATRSDNSVNLTQWTIDHRDDPAITVRTVTG